MSAPWRERARETPSYFLLYTYYLGGLLESTIFPTNFCLFEVKTMKSMFFYFVSDNGIFLTTLITIMFKRPGHNKKGVFFRLNAANKAQLGPNVSFIHYVLEM